MNTLEACLAGIYYLHINGIYHGDLKSKNIVFTDDGELKIADAFVQENYFSLDFATKLQRWNSFLPPECLTGGVYNGYAHDLWALGMIFLEASTLLGSSSVYTQRGLDWSSIYLRFESARKKYSPKLICILSTLLHKDPCKRREVFEIVKLDQKYDNRERKGYESDGSKNKDSIITSINERLTFHASKIQLLNDKLNQLPLEEIRKNLQESKVKGGSEKKNYLHMEPRVPFTPNTQNCLGIAPDPCREEYDSLPKKEENLVKNLDNGTQAGTHRRSKSELDCGSKIEKLSQVKFSPARNYCAVGSNAYQINSTNNKANDVNQPIKVSDLFNKVVDNACLLSPTYRNNKFESEAPRGKEPTEISKMIDRSLERSRSARKVTVDRTEKLKKLFDKLSLVSLVPAGENLPQEDIKAVQISEEKLVVRAEQIESIPLESKQPQEEFIIRNEIRGAKFSNNVGSGSSNIHSNSLDPLKGNLNSNLISEAQHDRLVLYNKYAESLLMGRTNCTDLGLGVLSSSQFAGTPVQRAVAPERKNNPELFEDNSFVSRQPSIKLTLREKIFNKCWTNKGKENGHQMSESGVQQELPLFRKNERNPPYSEANFVLNTGKNIDKMVEQTLIKSKEVIEKNLKVNSKIRETSFDIGISASYRKLNEVSLDRKKDPRVSERPIFGPSSREGRNFMEETIFKIKEDSRIKPPSFGIDQGRPLNFLNYIPSAYKF